MSEPAIQFESTGLQKITCIHCQRVYKLNKDGCPSKHFINHLNRICVFKFTDEQVRNFKEIHCNKRLKAYREPEKVLEKEIEEVCPEECPICKEEINVSEACSIPCKHIFHTSCLNKMKNDNCPLCRQRMGVNVPGGSSIYDLAQDSMLSDFNPATLRLILNTTEHILLELRNRYTEIKRLIEIEHEQVLINELSELSRRVEELVLTRRICFALLY